MNKSFYITKRYNDCFEFGISKLSGDNLINEIQSESKTKTERTKTFDLNEEYANELFEYFCKKMLKNIENQVIGNRCLVFNFSITKFYEEVKEKIKTDREQKFEIWKNEFNEFNKKIKQIQPIYPIFKHVSFSEPLYNE